MTEVVKKVSSTKLRKDRIHAIFRFLHQIKSRENPSGLAVLHLGESRSPSPYHMPHKEPQANPSHTRKPQTLPFRTEFLF